MHNAQRGIKQHTNDSVTEKENEQSHHLSRTPHAHKEPYVVNIHLLIAKVKFFSSVFQEVA